MTTAYITKAGDTIDGILWAQLQHTGDALEAQFWALNAGVSSTLINGVRFPQGVHVQIPAAMQPSIEVISPWD